MTDLVAARNTPRKISSLDMLHNYPLATSAVIFEGAGLAFDTTGKLVRASAATAIKTAGRARATNASAASGDRMDFETGIFLFNNGSAALTAADIMQPCYWEDDNTVGGDSSKLIAGLVYDVDSAGVWVAMSPISVSPASGGRTNKLIAGGAAYTVKPEDDGATVQTATDAAVITLPAVAQENKGMVIRVQNTGADGAALVSVSPAAADKIFGGLNGGASGNLVSFGEVANKDIQNTKATAQKGDYWIGQSDGSTGWYTIGGTGVWASEA